jgi:hypothetical protein
MPYVIATGQPNTLIERRYANEAGVRKRAAIILGEMEHWARRFNLDMLAEMQGDGRNHGLRADVLNCAFSGCTRTNPREFTITDEHSGVTWVFRLWKEN